MAREATGGYGEPGEKWPFDPLGQPHVERVGDDRSEERVGRKRESRGGERKNEDDNRRLVDRIRFRRSYGCIAFERKFSRVRRPSAGRCG